VLNIDIITEIIDPDAAVLYYLLYGRAQITEEEYERLGKPKNIPIENYMPTRDFARNGPLAMSTAILILRRSGIIRKTNHRGAYVPRYNFYQRRPA